MGHICDCVNGSVKILKIGTLEIITVNIPKPEQYGFSESSCLFYLRFNFDFYVSKIMHLLARNLPRKTNN